MSSSPDSGGFRSLASDLRGRDEAELVELLLHWEARPPGVLANGGVGVREVAALARRMGLEETPTHLLLVVARAAGCWPGGVSREAP